MVALHRLLTDRDGFFAAALAGRPSLAPPALVVAAGPLVDAGWTLAGPAWGLLTAGSASASPVAAGAALDPLTLAARVGDGVAGALLLWGGATLAVHAVASLLADDPEWTAGALVRGTAAVVGWGFLPRAVGRLCTGAVEFALVAGLGPRSVVYGPDLARAPAVAAVLAVASLAVGGAVTVWTLFCWADGLVRARDCSRERALLAVFPVVLVGFGATVVGFFARLATDVAAVWLGLG